MDAHALLTSQGWRGSGHSLHPTSDKTGLSRPLLASQKRNTLGLGKKQHRTSDMWWMNAFDKSLKGLDTTEEGKVVQTMTSGGLDMVANGGSKFIGSGGLYASFIRGESLTGTISPEDNEEQLLPVDKRKSSNPISETKEERRARKAARRAARARSLFDEGKTVPAIASGAEDENSKKVESREQRHMERKEQRKLLRRAEEEGMLIMASNEKNKKKKRRKE